MDQRRESYINPNSFRSQEHKSVEIDENFEDEKNEESLVRKPTHAEKKEYKDSLINKARKNIINRRLYNYNTSDMCYSLLC